MTPSPKSLEETLGDASRYPEIAAASQAITQPGGAHLTDPDLIDVGWTLHLPQPDPPPSTNPEHTGSNPTPVAGPRNTSRARPSPTRSSGTVSTAPGRRRPVSPTHLSGPHGAAAVAPRTRAKSCHGRCAPASASEPCSPPASSPCWAPAAPPNTATAPREHSCPWPTGATATVEHELRTTADVLAVESVDHALRALAHDCATTNTPLPVVRAARLTAEQFDLYLAHPSTLPHPWTGTTDSTVWTLHVDALTDLPDVDVRYPRPLPGPGHHRPRRRRRARVPGPGAPRRTRHHRRARNTPETCSPRWASSWPPPAGPTTCKSPSSAAYPELEDALQTGRIRYLPSVGRILDDLAERAAQDRAAMRAAGAPDLHHARVNATAADAWAPEILLLAGPVTPRQRNQLESLLEQLPRVAIAVVTIGVNVGEWTLNLDAGDDPDHAVLSPIGLQIRPQRIPAEQYGHILELAALTDVDSLPSRADTAPAEPTITDIAGIDPVDEPTAADVAAPPPAEPFTEPDEPADTKQHPDDSAEQGATLDPALTENTHSVSPADIQAATGPGRPAPAGAETVDGPPGEETSSQPSTDDDRPG